MDGLDAVLADAVAAGIPFVVAGVADRDSVIWTGAAGEARTDSVFALYSVTKAFTVTAALQCVEDELIDLDAPARRYVPEIAELRVLESLDEDGSLRTRPPSRDITVRMLLLHTSGLGYDMFDPRCAQLARERMRHPSATPLHDVLMTPLLHDPGERWTYGTSIDWLGLVVAAVRGQRLEDVFRERIYEPCGMASTSFDLPADLRQRLVTPHRRDRSGQIVPSPIVPPDSPEIDMGGQGLFSTVPDVLALLRVWLGDGSGVLRPETVERAVRGVPGVVVTPLTSAIPALTRDAEFFPGMPVSWATSFLVNDRDVLGGRRAGSLSWAGLGNVHYWIDRRTGLAAAWATQLLPFFDPVVVDAVHAFEQEVYRTFG